MTTSSSEASELPQLDTASGAVVQEALSNKTTTTSTKGAPSPNEKEMLDWRKTEVHTLPDK